MEPPKKWRTEAQLRGLQANVQGAINQCSDGATVELDLATARGVVEALVQARWGEHISQPPKDGA